MLRSVLLLSGTMLALSACGAADPAATEERVLTAKADLAGNGELAIVDASVKLNANPAAPSAAYFTVKGGDIGTTITGVQTADAERAEMHESNMEGGMMRMNAIADVDVPANGEVRFEQGGLHVMLFGLTDAARAAGKVVLSISFADGTTRDVEAPLVSVTGTPVSASSSAPARAAALHAAAPAQAARETAGTAAQSAPATPPVAAAPGNHDEHAGH